MASRGTFFLRMFAPAIASAIALGCAREKKVQITHNDPLGDLALASNPPPLVIPDRPHPTTLRVLIGGDVLPHRPSLEEPARIAAALEPLSPFFKTSDAVIVNYESATGDPEHAMKMAYVAPPEWLTQLKQEGVSGVTVANNHACDMGTIGVRTTLDAASAAGLSVIGGDAHAPFTARVIAEKDGKKVCAVAWTNLSNAHACETSGLMAYAPATKLGTAEAVEAVRRAKQNCDAVVAIFHGGNEYAPQTNEVLAQARRVADAGADAVVMHHPHIVSPVVMHRAKDGRNVPIFSSVGNLVTNQGESWKPPMFPVLRENRHLVCVNGWTRLGMLADLAFSFSGEKKGLSYATHLVFIDNEHATDKKAKLPKIDVRMLSPDGDKDAIARLKDDPLGPTAVFDDPCWFEASGKRCDADAKSTATASTTEANEDSDAPAARASISTRGLLHLHPRKRLPAHEALAAHAQPSHRR